MLAEQKVAQNLPSSFSEKFSAAYRLTRRDGYGHVIQAKTISDNFFKVFFVRSTNRNAKLGVIVKKKLVSGAVERNRIKRMVREVFRRHAIKHLRLDMVVLTRQVSQREHAINNLNTLFSLVQKRCAK